MQSTTFEGNDGLQEAEYEVLILRGNLLVHLGISNQAERFFLISGNGIRKMVGKSKPVYENGTPCSCNLSLVLFIGSDCIPLFLARLGRS